MRILRWAALVLAITAGYLAAPQRASAAPLPITGLATQTTANPLVTDVRWRRHGGWRRGGWHRRAYWHPRRHYGRRWYGPRRFYARPFYGPRRVCRVRYTAWGPRRVCFRRW
jgi:hypothetical protein